MQNKPIKTIFVCEFITGGGLNHRELSQSLLKQGQCMRDALLHDLSDLSYQVITTVDARLTPVVDCHICHMIASEEDIWQIWEEHISAVDAVWLVAPETGGELARLTALAFKHHKIILGSGLTAIEVCSSKLASYQLLKQFEVNTVETFTFSQWPQTEGIKWLAKPTEGAGCEQTVCFDKAAALSQWLLQHQYTETHVIQPYLAGIAGSISCVMQQGKAQLLSCNQQLIAVENNVLIYQGCVVNGMRQYWDEFSVIANQVAQLLPDLTGYIGIDIIVSHPENEENSITDSITVIEINPRLTSSYIGLRQAMGCNPAELIINTLMQTDYHWPVIQRNEVLLEVGHA